MEDKLLVETHGLVKKIEGQMSGINNEIRNGKRQRDELYSQIDELKNNTMKKENCEKRHEDLREEIPLLVENSVMLAMNGRKRAKMLIVKDVMLTVLGPAVGALIGYLLVLLSRIPK